MLRPTLCAGARHTLVPFAVRGTSFVTRQHVPGAGWSRRALLTGCGLAGGLALAGCAEKARPKILDQGAQVVSAPTAQVLKQILDRRAKAMEQGDERAFLADLDQNNAELIKQQKILFTNLRQFKPTTFRYITYFTGDGIEEKGVHRFGPVHEVVQLEADAGPGGVSPAATFQISAVQRGDQLVITELTRLTTGNGDKLGFSGLPATAPWYTTPLTVKRSGNVWLAGDASVTDLDRYAAPAEAEARGLEQMWGSRTRFPGHVLFFTKDEKNFATWFDFGASDNFQPTFEGIEVPQYGVRQSGEVYLEQFAGSRIVVNLKQIAMFGDYPSRVMRHELAHAITARATVVNPGYWLLGAPRWALEGFARWTEDRGDEMRRLAVGSFKGRLPTSTDFYGKDIQYNYAVSSTAFTFVERIKGREAVVEFYESVVQHSDLDGEAVVDLPIFNAICTRVLKMSATDFKQRWASFVRTGA